MDHIAGETLTFLKDLAAHNERVWFKANQARYEAARADFENFIDALIGEVARFDPAIAPLTAKDCTFRIHRDTRFSKDKRPYKTAMGAHMLAGGRKQERGRAGYYVHIAPGESFLAGGAHQPPGPWMAEIRKCIETDGDRLRAILAARAFKSCFGAMEGEKLKTAPRGYAKDHPELELLRHKSFLAVHKLTDGKVTGPGLLTHAAKMFAALKPFDDFLNGAAG